MNSTNTHKRFAALSLMVMALAAVNVCADEVRFTMSNFNVAESSGNALLVVERVKGTTETINVPYQTIQGKCNTATPGADYQASAGVIRFSGDDRIEGILIPVKDDLLAELDECFTVSISTGGNTPEITYGPPATVTIIDNDNACFRRGPSPDRDGNNVVDLADLNMVRNDFGKTGRFHAGDATCDGRVDLQDLNAVRNNFGMPPIPMRVRR